MNIEKLTILEKSTKKKDHKMDKIAMKKTEWDELKKRGYNTDQILRKVGELKDKGLTQDESVILLQEIARLF